MIININNMIDILYITTLILLIISLISYLRISRKQNIRLNQLEQIIKKLERV